MKMVERVECVFWESFSKTVRKTSTSPFFAASCKWRSIGWWPFPFGRMNLEVLGCCGGVVLLSCSSLLCLLFQCFEALMCSIFRSIIPIERKKSGRQRNEKEANGKSTARQ